MESVAFISAEAPAAILNCVVRIATCSWKDQRGIHTRRSIYFLRKKSGGATWFEDDSDSVGAAATLKQIVNLDECKDGIYTVTVINEFKDWESGIVEDWDYKLIPYKEPCTQTTKP